VLRNATPEIEITAPRPRPRHVRAVGACVALSLAGGLASAYQLEVRADRPPSFDQGGEFLATLPVAGADGRPYPYGDATAIGGAASSTTAPAATTSPPGSAVGGDPSAGPTLEASGSEATPEGTVPTATPPEDGSPAAAPLPAVGAYRYAVTGSESASGFGSRAFPAEATVVIHTDPSVPAGSLVHDLRLSDQHEERAIIAYGDTGAAFTYEAGSVTFGPGTQTSQGSYDPPMVQVPWPLAEGATATGTSAARDGQGNVTRTEQWTATVVGRELIDVLGTPHDTWVVDLQRNTVGGGAEQVDRYRRYWYDPQVGTWVRWTERFHGERAMLVTFTYDDEYTAVLTGFTPG
jgi:hypothetical protein